MAFQFIVLLDPVLRQFGIFYLFNARLKPFIAMPDPSDLLVLEHHKRFVHAAYLQR